MIKLVPIPIRKQTSRAYAIIESHLSASLQAIHLFGSAVDGGLKPGSDIDLLVTVTQPLENVIRRALMLELLDSSAPPGSDKSLRALEVTVICHQEISPWRYPAKREMQFGEWLRDDLLNGIFEPAILDIDLAILLKKVMAHSIVLYGRSADILFDPVPDRDFLRAMADTLKLWNNAEDWLGDERNVMLALARIWYSVASRRIAPKEVAADWLMERLPIAHRHVLYEAQQAYLTGRKDNLSTRKTETTAFILFAKSAIQNLLDWNKNE